MRNPGERCWNPRRVFKPSRFSNANKVLIEVYNLYFEMTESNISTILNDRHWIIILLKEVKLLDFRSPFLSFDVSREEMKMQEELSRY